MGSISDFASARRSTPGEMGSLAFSKSASHLVSDGSVEQLITRPVGFEGRSLILQADVGDWRIRPGDYVAKVLVDGTDASNTVQITAHGYAVGDGPFRVTLNAAGVIPTGLAVDTDYWIAFVGDANNVILAASLADAQANPVVPVDITADSGSGTMAFGASADGSVGGSGWANAADPTASVTDYGASKLGQGATIIGAAPAKLTCRAYSSGDVLTYWFV